MCVSQGSDPKRKGLALPLPSALSLLAGMQMGVSHFGQCTCDKTGGAGP